MIHMPDFEELKKEAERKRDLYNRLIDCYDVLLEDDFCLLGYADIIEEIEKLQGELK